VGEGIGDEGKPAGHEEDADERADHRHHRPGREGPLHKAELQEVRHN